MTLKEYIDQLNKLVKENPKALKYTVINAIDDEGNAFNEIYHSPSIGMFNGEYNGEFDSECKKSECNAVCVN